MKTASALPPAWPDPAWPDPSEQAPSAPNSARPSPSRPTAAHAPGFIETPLSGHGQVVRVPVVRNGCFGWLHSPADSRRSDVAVLICPSLFWDALQAYHSMRLLADEFAALGLPAMRFDYPGTGDSCDLPAEADPWDAWLASLHAAADWLRAATGAARIVLCGLRIGATLACRAAESRTDIAGLLLLAPVLRGSSYIKQLRVESQLQGGAPNLPEGALAFHELTLAADTVSRIAAIDLRDARFPAGLAVALFPQAASRLASDCAAAWQQRGNVVTIGGYAGLEPLLRVDVQADHPPPDFAAVTAWLRARVPPAAAAAAAPFVAPRTGSLAAHGWTEQSLRFGPDERLFGILCQAEHPAGSNGPAVVIVNTGRDPRYGIARFGAAFARHLARAGTTSLRFDFSGLGDSTGAPGAENLHSSLFETDRSADVAAAIDLLQQRGCRGFALHGICSGAYHAFHAAVADARVETLLLINLPVFNWRPGDEAQFVEHKLTSPLQHLRRLARVQDWRRLLGGQIDIRRLLRAQGERLAEQLQRITGKLTGRAVWHGPGGEAGAAMSRLAGRRVRSLFLFSPGDPGIASMSQLFGPPGAAAATPDGEPLAGLAGANLQIVPAIDHVLSRNEMQREVIGRMVAFIDAGRRRA